MGSWVHRPNHPEANEFGFIPKDLAQYEDYMDTEHLHMTVGNRKVSFYFNSDTMEPTQHMASGKYFTSKKKFRDETRAHGCVEVGNETKALVKPRKRINLDKRQRRDDIKKAIHQLRNGRKSI